MITLLYPVLTDELRKLPLYVTTIGTHYLQDSMERRLGYPDWHWLQCVSGTGLFQSGDMSLQMTPGTGVLLAPGVPHRYRPVDAEPWITTFVTFDGFAAAALAMPAPSESLVRRFRKPGAANVVEQRIQEMFDVLGGTRPERQETASVQLYAFLLQLRNDQQAPEGGGKGEAGFRKAFTWLEAHFAEDLTLDALSLQASVSRQHLCRLFRTYLGMRPFDYLTRYRIQRAKEMLVRDWKAGNEEIAIQCGFRDAGYFIRRFRSIEGVTPGEFRAQHGMVGK